MRLSSRILQSALEHDLSKYENTCLNSQQLFAISSLRLNFTKKCHDLRNKECSILAVEKFRARELINGQLNAGTFDRSEYGDAIYFLWKYFDGAKFVSFEELASFLPAIGPGKSEGVESTSPWVKLFNSKGSVSSLSAYHFYLDLVSECPLLSAAESLRCRQFGFPDIRSSRLTTVPKTCDIDRTICIEPSVNGALQQVVRHALERRLRMFGIDIATQPTVNRELARLGSLGHGYATIDLSSASDSITRSLTAFLFPRYLHDLFCLVSSDTYHIANTQNSFEMLCSMGNAITFPLQTVIFSAIVKQAYSNMGLPFVAGRTFSVFGDDIVVRTESYPEVLRLLIGLGFVPNTDKSFAEGDFRESCGADWFLGHNVRSVYARDLKDRHSVTALYNQVRSWCARHSILLPMTLKALRPFVFPNKVPLHAPVDSGIREPYPVGRFNRTTWSFDYLFFVKKSKKRRAFATDHRLVAGFLSGYLTSAKKGDGGLYSQRERFSKSIKLSSTSARWSMIDPEDTTLSGLGPEHFVLYDILS